MEIKQITNVKIVINHVQHAAGLLVQIVNSALANFTLINLIILVLLSVLINFTRIKIQTGVIVAILIVSNVSPLILLYVNRVFLKKPF